VRAPGARTRLAALGLALALGACSTPLTTREKGALAGGAIGAGAGAIVGSQVGHPGTGALIGAGIGAVSGAVIGDAIQGAEQKAAAPPPAPAPPAPSAAAQPPQVVVAAPPPLPPGPPRLIWVPEWNVYLMDGYEVVYYNGAYYTFHGGQWWVAPAHTGPWAIVVTPPAVIAKLPPGHLHAHVPRRGCPPGLARQGRC